MRGHRELPTVVLLPGTGSDARFAEQAFAAAFGGVGFATLAVEPDPVALVAGYLSALDEAAAEHERIAIAGISLGAAVAVMWSIANPTRTIALALALPAWTADPTGSPAASSASLTAGALRANGLDSVVDAMAASTPQWLAAALRRSWSAQWPYLPAALDEAANFRGPTLAELAQISSPTVVIGATDDPIHPISVAREWANALSNCEFRALTLEEIGVDVGLIGERAVEALTDRSSQPPNC